MRSTVRIITNVTRDLLNEEEKWREMINFFLNKWLSVHGLMETEMCMMDGV